MQQEISLQDIEALIKRQAKVDVRIQQQAKDQILVHYLLDMKVQLVGVTDDALLFQYQLNKIASFVAKKLGKNIRTKKLDWDTEHQKIRLNLAVFGKFKPIFQQHKIVDATIDDNKLILRLAEK